MRFLILGPLEIRRDGVRVDVTEPRQRKALALLLLDAGRAVSIDRFIDAMWDGEPPATARRQVQNTVAALRRRLAASGNDPIEPTGSGYRLNSTDVDWLDFRADVDRARAATRSDRPRDAAEILSGALDRWRGPALAGLSGSACAAAATRIEEARLEAIDDLGDAQLATGEHRAVIERARRVLDDHPYRQRTVGQLMLALYRDRRATEALDIYTGLQRALADELGLDPDARLRDLHRRILAADPTLDAATVEPPREPPKPTAVPAQLPATLAGFVGRRDEQARLDELAAETTDALRVLFISGPAGVGKTSLAVEWAHRVRDRYPDGQLYIDMRGFNPEATVTDPMEALHRFLFALGTPMQQIPSDPDARVAAYRSAIANRSMLVVIDNVRDVDQVRPLLPGTATSLVLVTSRRTLSGLIVRHGAVHVPLGTLGRSDARGLLERRLGARAVTSDTAAVDRILSSCDGLPLALAIAVGRAIVRPHVPLRVLADQLTDGDGPLEALSEDDDDSNARVVFSWSYRALSADAARLFRLLGAHPGPDFTAPAVASLAAVPLRTATLLLRELADANLVSEHVHGRFRLHDLLHSYARELFGDEETEPARAETRRRMLDHYLQSAVNAERRISPKSIVIALPEPAPEIAATVETVDTVAAAIDWLTAETAVLVNMIRLADADERDTHVAGFNWAMIDVLHRRGQWETGLLIQEYAFRAARRRGDREREIVSHIYSAAFLNIHGDMGEAEDHLMRALDVCEAEGQEALKAQVHYQMSVLYSRARRHEDALHHSSRLYELAREQNDANTEVTALNALGWVYAELGRVDEALECCEKALVVPDAEYSAVQNATILDSIGLVLRKRGDHRKAIDCYSRALDAFRAEGMRYLEAISRGHLGDAHFAAGDPERARASWAEALTMFRDMGDSRAATMEEKLRDSDAASSR